MVGRRQEEGRGLDKKNTRDEAHKTASKRCTGTQVKVCITPHKTLNKIIPRCVCKTSGSEIGMPHCLKETYISTQAVPETPEKKTSKETATFKSIRFPTLRLQKIENKVFRQ